MPTTSSSASNCSSSSTGSTEPPLATLSYQDEQKPQTQPQSQPQPQPQTQPQPEQPASQPATEAVAVTTSSVVTSQPRSHFTSSHHHYHLPHQFQHPHHQNHHTHSVRVPTPTVPTSYAPPALDADGRSPGYGRRAAGATAASSALLSSSLLATPGESAQVASVVSPGRLSARSGSQHHVTIDESSLPHKSSMETAGPSGLIVGAGGGGDGGDGDNDGDHGGDSSEPPSSPGSSSQRQLSHAEQGSEHQAGQLTLMYHSHQLTSYPVMPAIKRTHRPSFVYPPMPRVKA